MSSQGIVRVLPLDATIAVDPGETLFEAAFRQGFGWPTRCFGQAQCTLCVVEVAQGAENAATPGPQETAAIQRVQAIRSGGGPYRLACRMMLNGPMVVRKDGVTTA